MIPGDRRDRRARRARDVDDELAFHIEEQIDELVARGRPEPEARREVMARFGDYADVRRASLRQSRRRDRPTRWTSRVAAVRQDVRLALRGLRRQPRFTVAVVLTLGLGVGATAGVFAVVDGVLLTPLPFPRADRLVRIYEQNSPTNRWTLSVADYEGLAEHQQTLSSFGGYRTRRVALTGVERPDWLDAGMATTTFFGTLGVGAERGRVLRPGDERQETGSVAVLSAAGASRLFGNDDPLGRTLRLDGVPYAVVGVLAPVHDELAGYRADVWVPLALDPPTRRGPFFLRVVGRLREGVDLPAARTDLARVSETIFPLWADGFSDRTALLTPYPLQETVVGDLTRVLLLLQLAVLAVLLIAAANVASLQVARSTARAGELGVRAALGASRPRLLSMLAVEGVVLAALGGVVGVALAAGGLRVFRAVSPGVPGIGRVQMDAAVVLVALALAAACGLIAGLTPALFGGLRARSSRSRGDRRAAGFRATLVAVDFALALPLLAAATLIVQSVRALQAVDAGFDPSGKVALRVSLPAARYPDAPAILEFWREALRRTRDVPAVAAAGLSTSLPPDYSATQNNFDLEDRPVAEGASEPVSPWGTADPGLFEALGVPLLEGRLFEADDTSLVVLVSRSWAERYLPDRSAVGRGLFSGGGTQRIEIVGVVGDVKYEGLDGSGDAVYMPLPLGAPRSAYVVAAVPGGESAGLEAVRSAIRSLDPQLPLTDASTLDERIRGSVASRRAWGLLLGTFSVVAACLAAVGVFGVLSHVVAGRTREIGVRIALGAGRAGVVTLVARAGVLHALVGSSAGMLIWLVSAGPIGGLLYDVGPRDARTLVGVTAGLILVALAAASLPALRAARVDPVDAIGVE